MLNRLGWSLVLSSGILFCVLVLTASNVSAQQDGVPIQIRWADTKPAATATPIPVVTQNTTNNTTTTTSSEADVAELPKTGIPALAAVLVGGLPLGIGLRKVGNSKNSGSSANNLWFERQMQLS